MEGSSWRDLRSDWIPAFETVSYRFMTIRVGATAIHQMPKGELVDCQIQPPARAGEEKVYEARCLRRSEAVVCHTILVVAYPFS